MTARKKKTPPHTKAAHHPAPHRKKRSWKDKVSAYFLEKNPADWVAMIVKFVASGVVSYVLQSLTISALWLPMAWREGITFGSSFIFLAFSEWISLQFPAIDDDAPATHGGGHRRRKKRGEESLQMGLVLVFLASFIVCLWYTNSLRTQCVWNILRPSEWWAKQFTQPSDGTTNQTAATNHDKGFQLPDFLNQENGATYFYLPPYIPDTNIENAVVHDDMHPEKKLPLRDGIRKSLDQDPMFLIDWARGAGADIRTHFSLIFMLLHFGMILSLAGAWGVYRKPDEFAKEAILHLLFRGG